MGIGNAVAFAIERVVAPVEGMHKVIAGRWFDLLGPVGRRAYAVGSETVYGSIRVGARIVGGAIDALRPGGRTADDAIGAWVNGLWGDNLGGAHDRLATTMTIRDLDGRPLESSSMASAGPDATGHLVVLVHGLVDTEKVWRGTDTQPGLVSELDGHPELTPVLVRYNTGLDVGTNAALLASLLEEFVAGWPVPVQSIALVGHSMGGLVASGAVFAGRRDGQLWVEDASEVIALGAPYRGAPLARLATVAAASLVMSSTTRPLAEFLDRRSGGIRGLASDVQGDVDSNPGSQPRFRTIAGVITNDTQHPVGRLVGDFMVRPSSTIPPGPSGASAVVVGGVNHFNMLRNRTVINHVMDWVIPKG